MILNSEQIVEKNILKLENSKGKPAQVGYDLSIKSINYLEGAGHVLKNRTDLPKYIEKKTGFREDGTEGWYLHANVCYEVTFWEGCKIPNNLVGLIRQRSSLLRNGAILHSSVFDPGFETDNIGSFIITHHPMFIEVDARIAQIYFHTCEPVASENLYNGQFQYDKWLNK